MPCWSSIGSPGQHFIAGFLTAGCEFLGRWIISNPPPPGGGREGRRTGRCGDGQIPSAVTAKANKTSSRRWKLDGGKKTGADYAAQDWRAPRGRRKCRDFLPVRRADFREIGHQSYLRRQWMENRQTIAGQHAEPVLRSLDIRIAGPRRLKKIRQRPTCRRIVPGAASGPGEKRSAPSGRPASQAGSQIDCWKRCAGGFSS